MHEPLCCSSEISNATDKILKKIAFKYWIGSSVIYSQRMLVLHDEFGIYFDLKLEHDIEDGEVDDNSSPKSDKRLCKYARYYLTKCLYTQCWNSEFTYH